MPLARESGFSHLICRLHPHISLSAQIFLILEVLWPVLLFLIIIVLRLQFPPQERPDGRREKAILDLMHVQSPGVAYGCRISSNNIHKILPAFLQPSTEPMHYHQLGPCPLCRRLCVIWEVAKLMMSAICPTILMQRMSVWMGGRLTGWNHHVTMSHYPYHC